MYTAVVLPPEDRAKLVAALREHLNLAEIGYQFQTKTGEELPHHMTINMDAYNPALQGGRELLGSTVQLEIDRFYVDHELNVCAARVRKAETLDGFIVHTINDENSCKHVTMCIRPPSGKPFLSNRIDWNGCPAWTYESKQGYVSLSDPVLVCGVVSHCM